jgi:hypothetical protein
MYDDACCSWATKKGPTSASVGSLNLLPGIIAEFVHSSGHNNARPKTGYRWRRLPVT